MNRFAAQRNGFAGCEEVRCAAAAPFVYGRREPVLCPKPQRAAEPARSLRLHQSNQMEQMELTATSEILSIILRKDGCGNLDEQQAYPVNLFGSPPTRTANPLIHDPHFIEAKNNTPLAQFSFLEISTNTPMRIPTSPKAVAKSRGTSDFGPKPPAPMRIEGFDCLGQERRGGCGVSAFA